ncbi:hypothetical protein FALBO_286 [Fusarium albosuccineum]|uniref:Uncharacterized protein n=1 Tax=Fusarium albosuccineum TaxID=1237068 RepID=A0A8H4LRI6_9HYPO|nr:hypothetical protein FALBO_286 [Fusarium albosuccineum]
MSFTGLPLDRPFNPALLLMEHDYPVGSIKRELSQTAPGPIIVSSRSPSPAPRSSKRSREQLFAALATGNFVTCKPRRIASADDLDERELKRCFEILHACGVATDPTATLASTKDTMGGFLDAVFRDWTGNLDDDDLARPAMDFVVREYISVGNICGEISYLTPWDLPPAYSCSFLGQPTNHRSSSSCAESTGCDTLVFALATYRSKVAQLEVGFCANEPPHYSSNEEEQLLCPMERADVRWDGGDWMSLLKAEMRRSCTTKIHRYNKHLAVWYARRLIREWAMGSPSMGEDKQVLSFVERESVDATFAMMGSGKA